MEDELAGRRVEYDGASFDAHDAGDDPMLRFAAWFDDAASRAETVEPNAMAVATSAPDGSPSVRMVLLKGIDAERAAFTFYTNLDSRKAREATGQGHASLCWWWPGRPGRQVRAAGRIEPVELDEAVAYFDGRPEAARIGAIASRQSRAVGARAELEARAASVDAHATAKPERWGGLRVVADELEFWQGRPGRLHDRIAFLRLDVEGGVVSHAAVEAAGGEELLRRSATAVTDAHGMRWLRVRLEP